MRYLMWVFTLTFVIMSGSLASADPLQLGNIIYQVPKGWKAQKYENGVRFHYQNDSDAVCAYCPIIVHMGAENKGRLDRWMKSRLDASLDDEVEEIILENEKALKLGPRDAHMITRMIEADGRFMQVFIGFEVKNNFEMIEIRGRARNQEKAKEILQATSDSLLPMLLQMKFVSEGAKPLLGEPKRGSIEGIYWGMYPVYTLGLDGMMQTRINDKIFSFYKDGRFYEGVSPDGYSKFDFDKLVQIDPLKVGNYVARRRKITLYYADGSTDELRIKGKIIVDGDADMSRVKIPEDGFRFDGVQSDFFYSGFSIGSGISGGVASSSTWVFYKDGTFTSDSFSSASGSFDSGGGFATSSDGKDIRGKYVTGDGIIKMQFPDGETLAQPFFIDENSKGDDQIIVNGEYLSDDD